MTEQKPFASLSPTLLARKGGAKPAMRPQMQPLFHDSLARAVEDDLGWNDMGEELEHDAEHAMERAAEHTADIVPILPDVVPAPRKAIRPAVVRQREAIAVRVADDTQRERRSALAEGRRAAFTLRVDGERHLKLRLACTIRNRSAQQLVTEALDRLLDELPDLGSLAAEVVKKR